MIVLLLLYAIFFTTGNFSDSVGAPQNITGHNGFGATLWKYKTGDKIFSSPLLYQHLVLFGSGDNNFYALDARDQVSRPGNLKPADPFMIFNNHIFFGARDGYFYALDAVTGQLTWKYSACLITPLQ